MRVETDTVIVTKSDEIIAQIIDSLDQIPEAVDLATLYGDRADFAVELSNRIGNPEYRQVRELLNELSDDPNCQRSALREAYDRMMK